MILEKLPTVVKEGPHDPHYQTEDRFQEKTFDIREIISTNEWQQQFSHETFDQTKYCPSRARQYHPARINSHVYPEPQNMLTRKAEGVDRAFPLKPIYHKRSFRVNIDTASNDKNELQRLPCVLYVPSPPQGHPECNGRVAKAENRKPLDDHLPRLKDYTNGTDVAGPQQFKGEQLPEEQRRLARDIYRKELKIQEKLLKIEEQLRRGIQMERFASADGSRREERYVRRPVEMEKGRIENRVSAEHWRRDIIGDQDSVRRERSITREKAQKDTEWQKQKREKNWERQVKQIHTEDWDRGERGEWDKVKKTEWSTERRKGERGMERERDRNEGRERQEREKLKERDWTDNMRKERDEKDIMSEREQKLLRNRREREKGRAEVQSRKIFEEDIDWEREKNWERSRESYGWSDEKRREQGEAQHKPDCRRVTEGSSASRNRMSQEPSHTPVSGPPHSNSPRESAGAQLIPCKICHRTFVAERLEKHHKVCEKMQKSNRKVFDSSRHRAKGTELEKFLKTNSRSKTPELKKSNGRQKHEFIHNLHQAPHPDGSWHRAPSIQEYPERRKTERGMERERDRNERWKRQESEKLKERDWTDNMRKERDEKDIRSEREKKLLRNRGEREKGRAEVQSRTIFEEDIDWEREKNWERSRESYVWSDEKRREQGEAQHKPDCRRVTEGSSASRNRMSQEPSHTSVSSPPHSNSPRESAGAQLIPCKICHRTFVAERLEKHHKVCEKMQKSNRKVFDSSRHRAKGTELEKFLESNSRSKTPERKKNNWRQKHEFSRNLRQVRAPNGSVHPAPSIQDYPDYVTCPHCARRFASGPAERHIPKCQNIKSRPPPPRNRC